ncbi:hypothetical protein [Pyxidicoccus trucidator]|uniref:hypothetical protein n=1 Tax=Pyxidicoccus trucidator TaxID=2709662 RepID=UPI0013D926D7|nr:hypothetical protein [Pyxidicoccus trucidator]
MKLQVIALLLTLTACKNNASASRQGIVMPSSVNDGTMSYSDVEEVKEGTAQIIPTPLLEDRDMAAQARNCAVAYNDALAAYRRCGFTAGFLKAGQLISAGVTVIAAGVGPNTSNDTVQRHWTYAGITGAAALAFFTGFDSWLNCGERTFVQQALASQRLASLHNAGHLAACANRLRKKEAQVQRASFQLKALMSEGAEAGSNLTQVRELLDDESLPPGGLLEAIKTLEAPVAGTPPQDAAQLRTFEEKRARVAEQRTSLADSLKELLTLRPVLCNQARLEADAESKPLEVQDYVDRAHEQLVQCLSVSPTRFNVQSVTTAGNEGG